MRKLTAGVLRAIAVLCSVTLLAGLMQVSAGAETLRTDESHVFASWSILDIANEFGAALEVAERATTPAEPALTDAEIGAIAGRIVAIATAPQQPLEAESGNATEQSIVARVNEVIQSESYRDALAQAAQLFSTPAGADVVRSSFDSELASGAVSRLELFGDARTFALLLPKLPSWMGTALTVAGVVGATASAIACAVTAPVCGTAGVIIAGGGLIVTALAGLYNEVQENESVRTGLGRTCKVAAALETYRPNVNYSGSATCNRAKSYLLVTVDLHYSTGQVSRVSCSVNNTNQCGASSVVYNQPNGRCFYVETTYYTDNDEVFFITSDNKCV